MSLALYYYSNGRPASEQSPQHDTRFRRRPEAAVLSADNAKFLARKLLPPIVMDSLRSLRNRLAFRAEGRRDSTKRRDRSRPAAG